MNAFIRAKKADGLEAHEWLLVLQLPTCPFHMLTAYGIQCPFPW